MNPKRKQRKGPHGAGFLILPENTLRRQINVMGRTVHIIGPLTSGGATVVCKGCGRIMRIMLRWNYVPVDVGLWYIPELDKYADKVEYWHDPRRCPFCGSPTVHLLRSGIMSEEEAKEFIEELIKKILELKELLFVARTIKEEREARGPDYVE